MYAYIDVNTVYEVYDEIKQYSEDFRLHCVAVPDDTVVEPGYLYADGTFIKPPTFSALSASEDEIEAIKTKKIAESKLRLSEWLENNPMLYTDGRYYSVTAEKQSLLNGNLASYERAKNIGIPYPLKWNSTGDECTEWEYPELLKISLMIAVYVAPKVSMQQSIELAIEACTSLDEINAVVIDYDNHTSEN